MDISIIIVNYKSKEKVLKCIAAVKHSDLIGIIYEIILIDNASNDNIFDAIRERNLDIILIQSLKNLGMGAGNNLGIAKAKGEYFLILNPDTYVGKNTIKILHSYLKENRLVGIVGPKMYYPNGQLQYTCFRFPKIYTFLLRRTFLGMYFEDYLNEYLMKDYNREEIKEVDWIMGSCILIRKSIMNKIGKIFDDRFWMYLEDTDLCRRIWEAGYKVVYNPKASAIHDHGRGSSKYPWYIAPFKDKLSRAHIISWFKYFSKWKFK